MLSRESPPGSPQSDRSLFLRPAGNPGYSPHSRSDTLVLSRTWEIHLAIRGADGGQTHAYGTRLSTIGSALGNPVRYMHRIGREDWIAVLSGECRPLLPLRPVIGAGGRGERLIKSISDSTPGVLRDICRQSQTLLAVMVD